ncbi:hypothetical protein CR513_56603, partial [Mucuna pruriens]
MLTMFIDTLSSPFYDKVVESVASSFTDLVTVGERIKSGIKRGKFAQINSSIGFAKKLDQEKKGKSQCHPARITIPLQSRQESISIPHPNLSEQARVTHSSRKFTTVAIGRISASNPIEN